MELLFAEGGSTKILMLNDAGSATPMPIAPPAIMRQKDKIRNFTSYGTIYGPMLDTWHYTNLVIIFH